VEVKKLPGGPFGAWVFGMWKGDCDAGTYRDGYSGRYFVVGGEFTGDVDI